MSREESKEKILARLRRIEGQIRGLQRMLEKGDSCSDIMIQIAAVTSAIKKVAARLIQAYIEECIEKSQKETGEKGRADLKEFRKAISRYIDWS